MYKLIKYEKLVMSSVWEPQSVRSTPNMIWTKLQQLSLRNDVRKIVVTDTN